MTTARTEPTVHPEYPKCVATHIWEISEGVFDFSDETENFSGTQYPTIEAAQAALKDYCAGMPNGKKADERCIHLQDSLCSLFGLPTRPQVCSSFQASEDICGSTYEESAKKIQWYERMTS